DGSNELAKFLHLWNIGILPERLREHGAKGSVCNGEPNGDGADSHVPPHQRFVTGDGPGDADVVGFEQRFSGSNELAGRAWIPLDHAGATCGLPDRVAACAAAGEADCNYV